MATSSVNLLGQVVTVTANVSADPTSNKNMGALQAVLFQYYGLIYLGGQFAAGQVTLQLQDTNQPPLSALSVVGAVSDALAASIGDPGNNIVAVLSTSAGFGNPGNNIVAVLSTSAGFGSPQLYVSGKGDLPLGNAPSGGSITGAPGGTASTLGGFGLLQSIQSALSGAWNAIQSALKALFSDLQTGAIVLLVAVAIIAVLFIAAKS